MKIKLRQPGTLPSWRADSLGFTLVELIITITIAGILAAVAIPSYRSFVQTQRIKAASFDLLSSLTLARSEAIRRNASVSMTSASGGWQNGWTIVSGTTTLRSQSSYSNLTITDSANTSTVTFKGSGRLSTASTKFTVNTSPSSTNPRCVTIGLSGQATTTTGACS